MAAPSMEPTGPSVLCMLVFLPFLSLIEQRESDWPGKPHEIRNGGIGNTLDVCYSCMAFFGYSNLNKDLRPSILIPSLTLFQDTNKRNFIWEIEITSD